MIGGNPTLDLRLRGPGDSHHSHISLSLLSISPLNTILPGIGVFSVEGPTRGVFVLSLVVGRRVIDVARKATFSEIAPLAGVQCQDLRRSHNHSRHEEMLGSRQLAEYMP